MSSLKRKVQCNPNFSKLLKENQREIMEYVQLQVQFCADVARNFSISDPDELSTILQDTLSFTSNVVLSDPKVLREIIDLNIVPLEMSPSPIPIDLDEESRRLEVEAPRRSEIQRRQLTAWLWSWVPWPFTTKGPAATQQQSVKGTKRAREDDDEEEPPSRRKVIRKCKSTAVTNKQNYGP
ncbi:dityrosine transporter [Fusarium mundagurra]|uniref:Dityrosine transporter n=1 Tax=Fusarium mundagurra TaxID=1567541 RepID=A0A8H5XTJ1_9HYPO|nr:dityrosine transporter [Fusarium mundagurra]